MKLKNIELTGGEIVICRREKKPAWVPHLYDPLPDNVQRLLDADVLKELKKHAGTRYKISRRLKKRRKWGEIHDILQKLIEIQEEKHELA